jgi:hypothetical protein
MFGYASPVIQLLFQELPDAEYTPTSQGLSPLLPDSPLTVAILCRKCDKYVTKAFEESSDSPVSPAASPKRLGEAEADSSLVSRTLRAEKKKQMEVEKLKAEVRQLQEQLQARKRAVAMKNSERRNTNGDGTHTAAEEPRSDEESDDDEDEEEEEEEVAEEVDDEEDEEEEAPEDDDEYEGDE